MTQLVAGIYVASAVVTLMHWLRVHDRRLLPLLGFFLAMAAAESLEPWDYWRSALQVLGAACGLALLPMLDRRQRQVAAPPQS
jgi:Ni,Fe-hydrogenase I cytochrome b subunit